MKSELEFLTGVMEEIAEKHERPKDAELTTEFMLEESIGIINSFTKLLDKINERIILLTNEEEQ